ncbi:MAG: OmpA family protein [Elusimicrobia bacterium]|nr:OmpA family protein [Candidatus Obscuribacterium magneticum]
MIHRFLKPRIDDFRSQMIWLTVYSDLITNLVLVFLALYGLTLMGDEALAKAIQSMKLEDIKYIDRLDERLKFSDVALVLRQELHTLPDVSVSEDPGVTRIEFGERVLFESGRADLKAAARPILARVANLLRLVPYTIVVEGHSDNIPIQGGGRYHDNGELSLARAMSVVNLLSGAEQIPPKQLAAAAYGPFRPRSSNLTAEGRRMNRRIEIGLFKDFPFSFDESNTTVKTEVAAPHAF